MSKTTKKLVATREAGRLHKEAGRLHKMDAQLGKEKLSLAEKLYGRKFANDADLIAALQNERFERRDAFMAKATRLFGFEFTTALEVFRIMVGLAPD